MPPRRRFRPTARRKMIWARSQDLFNLSVPATGFAADLLAQFRTDGGSSLGATVTRVRLDLTMVWTNTSPAVFDLPDQLVHGVLVDQIQASQAEVPRPGVELHADWMYWRRVGPAEPRTLLPLAATGGITTSFMSQMTIDVQSQRKCEELGQTLWWVIDPAFGGTTAVSVNGSASVLLKLP